VLIKNRLGSSAGLAFFAALVAMFAYSGSLAIAAPCENLSSLSLPHVKITLAESVAPGAFTPPGAGGIDASGAPAGAVFGRLPAFCRVAATLTPSSDSDIKIEMWLPASGWNGKFQAVGNGGWAGVISYNALALAVAGGYATVSTDTGHTGNTGSFAFGHPEKMIDFAYRSEHEMTVAAKAVVADFYGRGAELSYWNGCSTGGRQALTEAQRYPSDFNGIIAEANYIPPIKYAMIHKAVLGACDAVDGLKDGLIGDPTRCHFDPKVLACKGDDGPSCLTAAQVETARKIFSPAKNPQTGLEIYPGLEPGSELGWAIHAGPEPLSYATDGFKFVTFKNPAWDYRTFNLDSDVALADNVDDGITSAMDPNLKDFLGRGGKLLMYHGWSDPNVSPLNTLHYYQNVLKKMDAAAGDSIRLFMFPGMGHCGGGEGPNTFDAMSALTQWVEKGQAPEQILASHRANGSVDRTRPVCAYPKAAVYKGAGSIDDATNFVCQAP
jgi:feruloyl esterase